MDYEKKYNEAMLRADEAVQKGCLDKATFDIIFPPEESEDERIRNKIIDIVKASPFDEEKDVLLAWLEKQKVPEGLHPEEYPLTPDECVKPAEWSEEDKLTVDAAIYWLERRLKTEKANDMSTEISPLTMKQTVDRLKSLRPQQKQEWSEEDERCINGLIGLIEDMKVGISPKLQGVAADRCIAFLHSILLGNPAHIK